MRLSKKRLLSPAMLLATAGLMVALAALIVALAGTAGAGPLASSSKLSKSEKKQVKRIASNQVQQVTFTTLSRSVSMPSGGDGVVEVGSCPGGQRSVDVGAAGGSDPVGDPNVQLISSTPMVGVRAAQQGEEPNGWRVDFHNSGISQATARAYVICAALP
jgi:hypothetical protein